LSGVQMTTRSTRLSAAAMTAPAASPSSASWTTCGHTVKPAVAIASSTTGNWASSSRGIPADDL
jgi:hypothetical protein